MHVICSISVPKAPLSISVRLGASPLSVRGQVLQRIVAVVVGTRSASSCLDSAAAADGLGLSGRRPWLAVGRCSAARRSIQVRLAYHPRRPSSYRLCLLALNLGAPVTLHPIGLRFLHRESAEVSMVGMQVHPYKLHGICRIRTHPAIPECGCPPMPRAGRLVQEARRRPLRPSAGSNISCYSLGERSPPAPTCSHRVLVDLTHPDRHPGKVLSIQVLRYIRTPTSPPFFAVHAFILFQTYLVSTYNQVPPLCIAADLTSDLPMSMQPLRAY